MDYNLFTNNWVIFGLILSIAVIQGLFSLIIRLIFRYLDSQKAEDEKTAKNTKEQSALIKDITALYNQSIKELRQSIDAKIDKVYEKFESNDNKYLSTFQDLLNKMHDHLESTKPHSLQIYENKEKIEKIEHEQKLMNQDIVLLKDKIEGLKH